MITSAFEGFLVPDRGARRRAGYNGGFAIPAYTERSVDPSDQPFLVTNARRAFIQPGVSREGVVRFGYSECDLEDEHHLLAEFYRSLWKLSVESGWGNRCSSIAQAKAHLESHGLQARTLLVPLVTIRQLCGQEISLEDARNLIVAQGYITEVDGLRLLFSYLPEGQMIMGTSPPLVGVYTRIDDHIGMLLRKIDQSVVLINELAR